MTRKHFKAIASVFAEHNSGNNTLEQEQIRRDLARSMAREMQQFNPAFDVEKFLQACEV